MRCPDCPKLPGHVQPRARCCSEADPASNPGQVTHCPGCGNEMRMRPDGSRFGPCRSCGWMPPSTGMNRHQRRAVTKAHQRNARHRAKLYRE